MPLPKKDDTFPRSVVTNTHPDFNHETGEQRFLKYRFYRESYEGSGGYAPYIDEIQVIDRMPTDLESGTKYPAGEKRTYLYRHPKEEAKFKRRVMMASLQNVIKRALNMITGFITKQSPVRDGFPGKVKSWLDKCNVEGDTWDTYKNQSLLLPVLYYGILPVMVHRNLGPEQKTEAQAKGNPVRVTPFSPENIVDWIWSERGYEAIKVLERVDVTASLTDESHTHVYRYWYFSREGWFYIDDEGADSQDLAVKDAGKWQGEDWPIVTWRLGPEGMSLVADAAPTQRELYNVQSEITEQRRESCFPWLCMPDMGGETNRSITGGTGNVLLYTAESAGHKPFYLSPDQGTMNSLFELSNSLSAQILADMGLDFDEEAGGASGQAMAFRMSKIVRMLLNIVTSMERYENQTLRLVGEALGAKIPEKSQSAWKKEFDAKDIAKELEAVIALVELEIGPSLEAEAKFRAATTVMPGLSEDLRDKGRKEIEEAIEEAEQGADDLDAEAAALRLAGAVPKQPPVAGLKKKMAKIDGEGDKVQDAKAS